MNTTKDCAVNSDSAGRLREAILYVCGKCEDDATFAATKLNKILWLADTRAYLDLGEPLTGSEYIRLPKGPAPLNIPLLLRAMSESGDIEVQEIPCFDYIQKRAVAKRKANVASFTPQQLAHLDFSVTYTWGMSAGAVSDMSHEKSVAWQTLDDGDLLPWPMSFLSNDALTPEESNHGRELSSLYGWNV